MLTVNDMWTSSNRNFDVLGILEDHVSFYQKLEVSIIIKKKSGENCVVTQMEPKILDFPLIMLLRP